MKNKSAITWIRTIIFLVLLSFATLCGDFLYTGEERVNPLESASGSETISPGEAFTGYFTPEYAYLANFSIAVAQRKEDAGASLVFQLAEADTGKALYTQDVPLSAVVEAWYLDFRVNQRLDTKESYVFTVSLEGAASDAEVTLHNEVRCQYNVIVPVRLALFLAAVAGIIGALGVRAFVPRRSGQKEWSVGKFLALPFFKTGYSLIHVAMFGAVTLGAIVLRVAFVPVKSNDYYLCYEVWINEIRQYGGIESLGHVIGNYPPLFMIILGLLSYLPFEPLVIIKLTPCIFDFIMALLSVRFLKVFRISGSVEKVTLYAFMLLNPVTLLNSAAWGQCDVVYTVFLLLALYGLCSEGSGKWYATGDGICLLFGIAFCLKLQALFFLPVLGLVWITQKRNRLKPVHLLWVPGLYIASCIPAWLQGRSLKQMFKIYPEQSAGDYGGLSVNYPNLYSFIGSQDSALRDSFFVFGLLFTFFVLLFFYYWIYSRQSEPDALNLCKVTAATVLIVCFFLPSIHERYSYPAEMLLGILMIAEPKYRKIAAATFLCTTVTYCTYLYETEFAFTVFPAWVSALVRFVCIIYIVNDILRVTVQPTSV